MKSILTFLISTFCYLYIQAQSQYQFTYDASGNRIAKELVGNAPVPKITGDTLACTGQNKTFTVNQASVASYKWDNGATTQSLTFTADSSRYRRVTVTYTNGCINNGRRWVQVSNLPIGNLVGLATVALNQTQSYTISDFVSGNTYTWEVINGSFTGSNTTTPVDVLWNINSAPAVLKVTRSNSVCTTSKTFPITITGVTPCSSSSLTLVSPSNNRTSGAVTYKVGQTIGATNKLTGGTTNYSAGKSITLNPGFEAMATNFKAQIEGCN